MTWKVEMIVRRGIVILALLLTALIVVLVHGRMAASTEARNASFFENGAAIQGAFQKALGPHPPVIELAIEPGACTARVVIGAEATQSFSLDQASGFVRAGERGPFPERDDIAFAMSTVPFSDLPSLVAAGARSLGVPPARLLVDRPPAARALRFRAIAADGREAEVKIPDR